VFVVVLLLLLLCCCCCGGVVVVVMLLLLCFPFVGEVTLAKIFKMVDLPAPFGPIMPKTSPGFKLKETFFSAQKSSGEGILKTYPEILLKLFIFFRYFL